MSADAQLIRLEVTFWAMLILGNQSDGWGWKVACGAMAAAIWIVMHRLERSLKEPSEGFWSKVWRR
jgi:hypothetical protein